MKIFKKFGLGVAFGLALVATVFSSLVFSHQKALAATTYTATWVDRSNITVTGNDSSSITLTDSKWDHTWRYDGNWNNGSDSCPVKVDGFGGNQIVGLTQRDGSAGWDANASHAKLTVQTLNGTSCVESYSADIFINSPENAKKMFTWQDSGTIVRVDGSDGYTFSNPHKQSNGSYWFTRDSESSATTCRDIVVVSADNTSVILYELNDNDGGLTNQRPPPNIDPAQTCYLQNTVDSLRKDAQNGNKDEANSNVPSGLSLLLANVQENSSKPPSASGGGSTASCSTAQTCTAEGDTSGCVANSHVGLEWILCPITSAIGKASDQMNNFIEAQLNLNVDNLFANSGCTASDKCQVKKAWTIIKDVVSALVVVLMLIMVLGQAIGGQYFDAYTVKKMLPRLVIAVILMQFSFVIGRYLVEIANDTGVGIKQLMLAPFGGGGNMDLNSILHHLNPAYAGVTNLAIGGAFFLLFKFFGDFIAPLVIFIAVAIASALLTALATLVFRNVIILGAVIFAPLALLLWATPSQSLQGYWKKYTDNFIKALLLFPIVTVVIYGGRVVAWLAGGQGSGLIDYMVVLIAFFAPYFILPRTFKWGGQLLAGVSQEINNNRVTQAAKRWGYGVAKSNLEEVRGHRARDYTDDPQSRRYMNLNSRLGRGLWALGGRRLIAKKVTNPDTGQSVWVPRKVPMDKQKRNMLGAGMVFENEINRKKIARQGKAFKEETDSAWEELDKRASEKARSGNLAAGTYLRSEDGKLLFRPFAASENNIPGYDQYYAIATRDLFSSDKRRAENAARWLGTSSKWGIHSNNPVPLDVDNDQWKFRQDFERAEGLSGTFNADRMSPGDARLMQEWGELDALQKQGTISAAQQDRLDHLMFGMGLRVANHLPYSQDEIAGMNANLKWLEARGVKLIDHPLIPGLKLARMRQLRPFVTKSVGTTELDQATIGENYEDISDVISRNSRNPNAREVLDPTDAALRFGANPDDIVNKNFFLPTDRRNTAMDDHGGPDRIAQQGEATQAVLANEEGEAVENNEWGGQDINNAGRETLIGTLPLMRRLVELSRESTGGTTGAILSRLIPVFSSKRNFLKRLERGVPRPHRKFKEWYDTEITPGTQFATQAKNNIKETINDYNALGLELTDTGPIGERDLRIMERVPQFQWYFPHAAARFSRFQMDRVTDPTNRRRYPRANPADFPPGFLDAVNDPTHPERQAINPHTGRPGIYHGVIPDIPRPINEERFGRAVQTLVQQGYLSPDSYEPIQEAWDTHGDPVAHLRSLGRNEDADLIEQAGMGGGSVPTTRGFGHAIPRTARRMIVPDNPPARATAAQAVFDEMNGGTHIDLPPQVVNAVEVAHNYRRGDPAILIDPARGEVYGNYRPEALREKIRIVKNAVAAEIPGNDRFAREFASQIVARGIAGDSEPPVGPEPEVTIDPGASEIHISHGPARAAAGTPSVTIQASSAPMGPPASPNVVQLGSTPSVTNVTNVTQQTVVRPSATPGQVVSPSSTPAAVPASRATQNLGAQQGTADDRYRQQLTAESNMRHAFQEALKPIAEQVRESSGGAVNPDTNAAADRAARRISGSGPGRPV